ncbi:hypothetical protein DsansV1_C13g0125441 [Dioscorea sansibarensis]
MPVAVSSAQESSTSDWKSSSIQTEENCLIPGHVLDGANCDAENCGTSQINEIDKRKNQMEMNSIKIFHVALVGV